MIYIQQLLYVFLSTIGFAVIFNSPRDTVIKSGVNGAGGWLIYMLINDVTNSPIAATFMAALTVGSLGEIFAKVFKKPSTTFTIPGMMPLVPGKGMYYTMLYLTEKNFLSAADSGSQALIVSIVIASGIIVSSSFNRAIMKHREEKQNKKDLTEEKS